MSVRQLVLSGALLIVAGLLWWTVTPPSWGPVGSLLVVAGLLFGWAAFRTSRRARGS